MRLTQDGDPIQLSDDNTTYHIEVKDGERPSIELCLKTAWMMKRLIQSFYLRSEPRKWRFDYDVKHEGDDPTNIFNIYQGR